MAYQELPAEVTGYALDSGYSFWSVVVPEETTNLIWNPSMEYGSIGLSSPGSSGYYISAPGGVNSYAMVSEKQTRGVFSARVSPNGADVAILFFKYNETGEGAYSFSADIWHRQGEKFVIYLANEGGLIFTTRTISAEYEGWGRYSYTFVDKGADGSGKLRYVGISADWSSTKPWYTDRWQMEMKSYPTTYVDGDMTDIGSKADPYAYGWVGVPHQSISRRSATTDSGGRVVSLWDLVRFKTTAIVGLGMAGQTVNTSTLADGREMVTDIVQGSREFSIIGRIFGRDMRELDMRRQALIDAVNPALRRSGMVVIRYQPVDNRGQLTGKPLNIIAVNKEGLGGNFTNFHSSSLEMRFYTPFRSFTEDFAETYDLNFDFTMRRDFTEANNSGVAERDPHTGAWSILGSYNNNPGGLVKCAAYLPNGDIIVGGSFTTISGVSARRVAKYTRATKTWSEFAGGADDTVLAVATGKGTLANRVYIGGYFTHNGAGSTTMRHVAYTDNGSSWTEIATGLNDVVYVLTVAANNNLYVGGNFTSSTSAGVVRHIARWTPGASIWNSLGNTTSDGAVFAITIAPDGVVYIGGLFTTMAGLGPRHVIKYDPLGGIWSILEGGLNSTVYALAFAPDGSLYAGGTFNGKLSGPDIYAIARFNGTTWDNISSAHMSVVYGITFDKRGNAYIGGNYAPIGDFYTESGYSCLQGWNGSTWLPLGPIAGGGAVDIGRYVVGVGGHLLLPYGNAADLRGPGYTRITNRGSAAAKPIIRVKANADYGTLFSLSNWTTGKHIYFKAYDLFPGDELYLDLTGIIPQVYTIYQGDISQQVLLGISDLNTFELVPGENDITFLVKTTYASTSLRAYISFTRQHGSIEVANGI